MNNIETFGLQVAIAIKAVAFLLAGSDKARVTKATGLTFRKDAVRFTRACVLEARRINAVSDARARELFALLGQDADFDASFAWYRARVAAL